MNVFQQNLKYIEETSIDLYQDILEYLDESTDSEFRLANAKNSSAVLEYNKGQEWLSLYSKYNPQVECERWVEFENVKPEVEDILLYGLGLGYHLFALLEHYPDKNYYIYEPNIGSFIKLMELIDLVPLFNHQQIICIVVGQKPLMRNTLNYFLFTYAKLDFQLVTIPYYEKIDIEYLQTFIEQLAKFKTNSDAFIAFRKQFNYHMYINSLRNFSIMLKTPYIHSIKNIFDGMTAIVVGAGPSLEQDVELIREKRDEYFIIAAGSSIQSLYHHGITPHVIVSMDPGEPNANIFRKRSYSDIPLVYATQIHHDIVTQHPNHNIGVFFTSDKIINYLIGTRLDIDFFIPNMTVTGTAIQLAAYMGASKIVFAGQDFSYPDQKVYAAGAEHADEDYFETLKTIMEYAVPNVNGGHNPSTQYMVATLRNIEELIENEIYEDIEFCNITHSGAQIKGTTFYSYNDFKKLNHKTDLDFTTFNQALTSEDYVDVPIEPVLEEIAQTLAFCSLMSTTNKKVKQLLSKYCEYSRTNPNKAMKTLANLEIEWQKIVTNEYFLKVVETWSAVALNEYDHKVLKINKEANLIKKANMLHEALGKLLQEIDDILPIVIHEYESLQSQLLQLHNEQN